jgi:hypothetical protein
MIGHLLWQFLFEVVFRHPNESVTFDCPLLNGPDSSGRGVRWQVQLQDKVFQGRLSQMLL